MNSRKIIKFGNSSYVITLPYEWVKLNNLKKGDDLNIISNSDSLILNIKKEEKIRQAEINIKDKSLKLFNRQLISYYLKNFKFIKIYGKNIMKQLEEIKILKEKLSSLEIIEIKKDYIVLKDLTSPSELNIKNIINKIVEMEKFLFEELVKSENESIYNLIKNLDKNINKLTFLGYKAINYNLDSWINTSEIKNEIYYWRIISSFESIGDILKRIARYLININSEENHHLKTIFISLKNYFDYLTSLLSPEVPIENNLKLYLDKKQSLLMEFENSKDYFKNNINLYLVINQLLKDLLGKLDDVILSVIDINCKGSNFN